MFQIVDVLLFQALLSQKVPISSQHRSNRTWKIQAETSALAPQATATGDERSVALIEDTAQQGGGRASSDGGSRFAAAGLSLALSIILSSPASSLAAGSGMPGSGPGCTSSTNPSYSLVSCERTGLDRDGRLLGCRCDEFLAATDRDFVYVLSCFEMGTQGGRFSIGSCTALLIT